MALDGLIGNTGAIMRKDITEESGKNPSAIDSFLTGLAPAGGKKKTWS